MNLWQKKFTIKGVWEPPQSITGVCTGIWERRGECPCFCAPNSRFRTMVKFVLVFGIGFNQLIQKNPQQSVWNRFTGTYGIFINPMNLSPYWLAPWLLYWFINWFLQIQESCEMQSDNYSSRAHNCYGANARNYGFLSVKVVTLWIAFNKYTP